ncbi:MAG TPA: Zn-dependent alcohol dehydrogenase [Thermoanaerobaculia bacterium]
MKAAICHAFDQPLSVEDVTLDAPQSGEVKVRLAATAICHSDVHLIRGDWAGTLPVVAGHEAAGIVDEVGPNVTLTKPGDRVVVSLLRSCGRCFHCTTGAPHNCEGSFALDRESRLRNARGESLSPGIRVGAFAEAVVVDQSQVVRIPEQIPFDCAALLGCGVITGVGAVLNTARVEVGESVVIIGAGGVGLNAVQGAVLAGARPIVAIDRIDSKLTAATSFGATDVFNAAAMEPRDLLRAVRKLTGRGADYAFVTVGAPEALAQAQLMIRHGGTVVAVGMPALKATAALRMFDIVWSEQRVLGSRMGGTRLHVDVPRLVDLYLRGRLQLDALVSRRYPLAQINEAIAGVESGEALRNVVVFE